MFRACLIDFGAYWNMFLHLCELSYNNSQHSSIHMIPFKTLYGRGCRPPIGLFEDEDMKFLGDYLVIDAQDKPRVDKLILQIIR